MDETDTARSPRRRRLLFRATHRGMHETDLLVGGFVAARLDRLTDTEMDALERVLDLPDVELADWLTGRRPILAEAADQAMLHAIRTACLA